jgi:hypothetical protein
MVDIDKMLVHTVARIGLRDWTRMTPKETHDEYWKLCDEIDYYRSTEPEDDSIKV